MCFSATASFTASAVLVTSGVFSIKKVNDVRFVPLALIPFLFSFQQFCEGIVWLSFKHHGLEGYRHVFGFMYLMVAQAIWPMFVPFSMWLAEKDLFRRYMLAFLLAVGMVIGFYLGFQISSYPLSISIGKQHIIYAPHVGTINLFNNGFLYLLATSVPPFLSSLQGMSFVGLFVVLSFSISVLFYPSALVSVWCYFAAVISLIIIIILNNQNKLRKKES
jgi:hypothetical protein